MPGVRNLPTRGLASGEGFLQKDEDNLLSVTISRGQAPLASTCSSTVHAAECFAFLLLFCTSVLFPHNFSAR